MKIKSGDKVIVIAGKDKGRTGKVVKSFPREDKVIVEGVNMLKKHQRARKQGEQGQIVERAMPVHISNVSLIDPKSNKPTRAGFSIHEKGKTRIARKSGASLK